MGKITGFVEYTRLNPKKRPASERIRDYREFELPVPAAELKLQGARCMDCGVPFCNTGCPLGNLIPDWNDAVWRSDFEEASDALHATNNFPEVTGRICPAPCEEACVLNINDDPVSIKLIEKSIADTAFTNQQIKPAPSASRTGKRIAVVGSGPAGLACAQQLARVGHDVVVFERDDRLGGLLTYGIPDFKLEKSIVERRLDQMRAEGVEFRPGVAVGEDVSARSLVDEFDACCLAGGARTPRDLDIPGRDLKGVHFAMDFLEQQNRRVAGDTVAAQSAILAKDRHVVVIGGGDTGSDCIGTSHRQGAASVTNFEIMPEPPKERHAAQPWPLWPVILRTSSSHEEGGQREFSASAVRFVGEGDRVKSIDCVRVRFEAPRFVPIEGSEFTVKADLVLLAMGFTGPVRAGPIEQLELQLTGRGNVAIDDRCMTSVPGVFCAGDMQRGQSLVVWAIADGRRAAAGIDEYLMGRTGLPVPGRAGVLR